jgi:hypothetical protein
MSPPFLQQRTGQARNLREAGSKEREITSLARIRRRWGENIIDLGETEWGGMD